jgi:hypothetical protein
MGRYDNVSSQKTVGDGAATRPQPSDGNVIVTVRASNRREMDTEP